MADATVPKAELHVHVEGTAPPALLAGIAARNGLAAPEWPDGPAWSGLPDFLAAYDASAAVLRTGEDYRDVVFAYLAEAAAAGAVYVELTASPSHAAGNGLAPDEHFGGIAAAIDAAARDFGIEARIIVTAVRDLGPARALALVEETLARQDRFVAGFGLAGNEAAGSLHDFRPAFELAVAGGLGCTVHAGEARGPESVREALALPVRRIGHGVRAAEDPRLLTELAERGVTLELCPSSNVALGVYGAYADYPWEAIRAAGVRVTLNSDDPPYFRTTLAREYAVAAEHFGLGDDDLRAITRAALEVAFVDDVTRRRLQRRLDAA